MRSLLNLRFAVLDRDGTLIRHIPYLSAPDQVELLPTVKGGLQLLRDAGVRLVLHTNQSGVGKEWFSETAVVACNAEMLRQLDLGESLFERVCIAPERADQNPVYRKPSPKLGLEIMREYGLSTDQVCYMGDNITDLLTARNLGCMGIGVDTGGHALREQIGAIEVVRDFPVFDTFLAAAAFAIRDGV